MTTIEMFSEEIFKELKSYVYRLIDPRNGETFYVGKGKGNRIFEHIKGALRFEDSIEDEISEKYSRIREIQRIGLEVVHVIHRHGLDDNTAHHVESALIDAYPGTTNLIGGKGSDFGPMNALEIKQRYAAEVAELEHKVILIKINRTVADRSIYDAVRFAWKLDVKRAEVCEFVLAIEKGIIVGVFKAESWKKARSQHFPDFADFTNSRYGFIGEEASEKISRMYLHKLIPKEFREKGAANPIQYNYKKY